jgi:hypothetical protein
MPTRTMVTAGTLPPMPRWLTAFVTIFFGLSAQARAPTQWRDDYIARLEASVELQTLNAELLASRSATLVLERWCAAHRMADPPVIVAHRVRGKRNAPSAEQLVRLGVASADEVKYRRVELRCGKHVLSKADNWYVPKRLTAEMNRLLETTDTPFGKAVLALQPFRQTIEAHVLWMPLPEGLKCGPETSSRGKPAMLDIPNEILQHRALLFTSEHVPFSEVREVYQDDVLAFPVPSCAAPSARAVCIDTGAR